MKNSLVKSLFVAAILVIGSLLPVTAASDAPSDAQSRVIVTLAAPDSAPGAVATTTDALLASLPAGDFTLINRSATLPFLTLSVGQSAMSVLQSSSLVASIEADGTVSKAASAAKTKCKRVKRKGKKVKVCKKVKQAPSATNLH